MIDIINITRPLYSDELDAIEREADIDNRKSKTEMAAVLIREAIANRAAQRQSLTQSGGSKS